MHDQTRPVFLCGEAVGLDKFLTPKPSHIRSVLFRNER